MSNLHTTTTHPGSSLAIVSALFRGGIDSVASLGNVMLAWSHRYEERRRLAEMPDYLLRDLGINRAEADHEASKPFWKA